MIEYIKRLLLLLTVIGCLFSFQQLNICYAQQQSINLGVVSISIGAEKQGVINELKKDYNVDYLGNDKNSIMVVSKHGPPYESIGTISFIDGKVGYMRRYWSRGYEGTNPIPFFRTLYSLIKNYEEDGYRIAGLSTEESRGPEGVAQLISLVFKGKFGVKKIDISSLEFQGIQYSVNVDEVLEPVGGK